MNKIIIRMHPDSHRAILSALVMGALADSFRATIVHEQSQKDYHQTGDHMAEMRRDLEAGAKAIVDGKPEEPSKPLWHVMTDDDFIKAANFMEAEADRELAKHPGDYLYNYNKVLKHLAKAYYHADSVNQKSVRNIFGDVLYRYGRLRELAEEAGRG